MESLSIPLLEEFRLSIAYHCCHPTWPRLLRNCAALSSRSALCHMDHDGKKKKGCGPGALLICETDPRGGPLPPGHTRGAPRSVDSVIAIASNSHGALPPGPSAAASGTSSYGSLRPFNAAFTRSFFESKQRFTCSRSL